MGRSSAHKKVPPGETRARWRRPQRLLQCVQFSCAVISRLNACNDSDVELMKNRSFHACVMPKTSVSKCVLSGRDSLFTCSSLCCVQGGRLFLILYPGDFRWTKTLSR